MKKMTKRIMTLALATLVMMASALATPVQAQAKTETYKDSKVFILSDKKVYEWGLLGFNSKGAQVVVKEGTMRSRDTEDGKSWGDIFDGNKI